MLWYKNWLETRSRFFFILIIIVFVFTLLGFRLLLGYVKPEEINPPFLIVTLVSLSGFASLAGTGVRTQAGHLTMIPNPRSTVYTLSLPVSRRRLLLMRSALGLLEATILSLICTVFMGILLHGRATISDFTDGRRPCAGPAPLPSAYAHGCRRPRAQGLPDQSAGRGRVHREGRGERLPDGAAGGVADRDDTEHGVRGRATRVGQWSMVDG